ncbi:hypothetical protein C8R43DRAFT_958775 [Mycena crocata]|nr:hypothetical protein C8R43DRAFT_958775 [Mycena crocata]
MRIISIAVCFPILAQLLPAAADIIAWSGSSCDGGQGGDVACDGGCIGFQDRHSFRVVESGSHCVSVFEDGNCNHLVGVYLNQGGISGSNCVNVNTGTAIPSSRVSFPASKRDQKLLGVVCLQTSSLN